MGNNHMSPPDDSVWKTRVTHNASDNAIYMKQKAKQVKHETKLLDNKQHEIPTTNANNAYQECIAEIYSNSITTTNITPMKFKTSTKTVRENPRHCEC